jgi:toxin YoeB
MKVIFEESYYQDLLKLKQKAPKALGKLERLVREVSEAPKQGVGRPEQLRGYQPRVVWSRRIIGKHRLTYELNGERVIFLSCYGHYKDH